MTAVRNARQVREPGVKKNALKTALNAALMSVLALSLQSAQAQDVTSSESSYGGSEELRGPKNSAPISDSAGSGMQLKEVPSEGNSSASGNMKWFVDAIDCKWTMQFISSKPQGEKKDFINKATYKVLDVIELPALPAQMLADDIIELAFPCDKKRNPIRHKDPLPWAELKMDGIVEVHMPSRYLRKLETTSEKNIWQIENRHNRFEVVKPYNGRWLIKKPDLI